MQKQLQKPLITRLRSFAHWEANPLLLKIAEEKNPFRQVWHHPDQTGRCGTAGFWYHLKYQTHKWNTWTWAPWKLHRWEHSAKSTQFYVGSLRTCPQENFWNRPFYSCGLSTLAFEWMWSWRWPCFDTNLLYFVMDIVLGKY